MNHAVTPDHRLARIQATSGLVFGAFLAVHLVNTLVAPAGQDAYDRYQLAARTVYQCPPVEIALVLGAVAVHVAAAALRIRLRRRERAQGAAVPPEPLRQRLHRWTGYVLALAIVGHVVATRGPGVAYGTPADFSFLTYSLESVPGFFYGYYILFGASGAYHLVNGALVALALLGVRIPFGLLRPRSRAFWAAVALLALAMLPAAFALGGAWFEVDRVRYPEFRQAYARFLPASFLAWLPDDPPARPR